MFQFPRIGLLLALSTLSFTALAAEAPADLGRKQTVGKQGSTFEHYCTEMEDVQFVGNDNRIETRGPCNSILVQGSGNVVDVQSLAAQITVNGDNNKVTWPPADRPKPATKVSGKNNVVEQVRAQ